MSAYFCQTRVMLSFFSLFFVRWVYFLVLIINKLETILKINQKYFEKCLQVSKVYLSLYRCKQLSTTLKNKQNEKLRSNTIIGCKSFKRY